MEGAVSGPARAGPESTGGGRTSLALGLLLLATDEVRAILDTARKQVQLPVREQAMPDPPGHGGLREPLIGVVFGVQRQLILAGARLGRPWWRGAGRAMVWVWQTPPLAGLRTRVEAEAVRLARSGAEQDARSRRLAATVVAAGVHRVTGALLDQEFEEAYQRAITLVVQTPEIAELVREQSAGLAQELVSSVRDRAVTGDDLVERLVGRLLRRRTGGAGVPLPRVDGADA